MLKVPAYGAGGEMVFIPTGKDGPNESNGDKAEWTIGFDSGNFDWRFIDRTTGPSGGGIGLTFRGAFEEQDFIDFCHAIANVYPKRKVQEEVACEGSSNEQHPPF